MQTLHSSGPPSHALECHPGGPQKILNGILKGPIENFKKTMSAFGGTLRVCSPRSPSFHLNNLDEPVDLGSDFLGFKLSEISKTTQCTESSESLREAKCSVENSVEEAIGPNSSADSFESPGNIPTIVFVIGSSHLSLSLPYPSPSRFTRAKSTSVKSN